MNTLNVPSIICNQFPSLRELSIRNSRIETISQENFAFCHNIRRLNFEGNLISRIPDYMVGKKRQLEFLNLNDNRISSIGVSPFIYTSLNEISLSGNQLTEFEPLVFNDVSETLTHLYLSSNLLTTLPSRAFSNLTLLRFLSLNVNQLQIPSDAFSGLENLFYLNLGETGLIELDVGW